MWEFFFKDLKRILLIVVVMAVVFVGLPLMFISGGALLQAAG